MLNNPTIKDLKEFIKDLPDDMEVMTVDSEWGTESSSWEVAEDTRWIKDKNITYKYLRIS